MRTALLVLCTVVLLVGGFAVYWAMQPARVVHGAAPGGDAAQPVEPLAEAESTYTVRGGKNVWLKEFDNARRLTNQFRAEEFVPQKEGFVRVRKPEAHFFLRGGQWIRVTGVTGDVVVAGMPQQGSDPFAAGGGGAGMPSRGRLDDVRVQFYETADAPEAMLDMTMPNAAFDNESFQIFTEGYTDKDGTQVPADQVKVTVRGKYEFDGRGLTIRWNDRDRRLELLEIAHGERLIVKEPGALGMDTPPATREPKANPAALRIAPDPATALASADPSAGAAVAGANAASAPQGTKATTGPTTRRDSTLYSIWFYDNVQVVQSEKTLATGNVIEVFYSMRESPEKPATAPGAVAPQQVAQAQRAPGAADEGLAKRQAADGGAAAPDAAPATKPAQEPVIVYWTGKLRIVPSQTEPPAPLEPGDSAVQLRGSPALLTRDNMLVRSPAVTYLTGNGRAMLRGSKAFPQVEIEQYATAEREGAGEKAAKPELTLLSEWVEYAPQEGVAKLGGNSRAVFPADQGEPAAESGETAQATWTREAVARFTGSGNQTVIENLLLTGDVDVRHPQVLLTSQRLNLAFDPPAPGAAKETGKPKAGAAGEANGKPARGQPVVREVVAEEAVHCVLVDEDGAPRELRGEHLTIHTAPDKTGKLYPKQVVARGDVRAVQEGDELSAQELTIDLVPAAPAPLDPQKLRLAAKQKGAVKPGAKEKSNTSVELKQLVARRNVRAVSAAGDVATGDTLVVTNGPDGKPEVGLVGKPASVANATGTVITSEKILMPSAEQARAIGPGTLHAPVEDKDPKAPKRHMNVSWTESALFNATLPENQVQVMGQVRASVPDADGTVNTAIAQRILITLVDAPPAPATQPATPKKPVRQAAPEKAQRKGGGGGGTLASTDVDVMKGKQVSRILLTKDAVVDSRLAAADGTVLREMRIDSSLLQYNVPQRRLIIPRPGRMLVRDHRPPEVQPAGQQRPAQEQDGLASNRGATAFQWSESLDYNGAEQRARMSGEVIVAYKPDDSNEPPVRLRADEVVATFEEVAAPAKGAAGAVPAASKSALDMKAAPVQLRSVRAEGNVVVRRGGDELTAPRLTYDPVTHWIRAVGTDQTAAVYSPAGRGNGTTGREFHWNTQTWKMRVVNAAGRAAAASSGR